MKIKRLGFTSFRISTGTVDIVTDPLLAVSAGISFKKTTADVVLLSGADHQGEVGILESEGFKKVVPTDDSKTVFEIASAGEYEVGGVIIRRSIKSDFYVIDDGHIRVVYLGKVAHKVEIDDYSELGDVDVLIIPVGDSDIFPSYDKLDKIVKKIDPTYLLPCGFKEDGLSGDYKELKSAEDFIKNFGYTRVTNDKTFKITSGSEPENKIVEVVVLA